MRTTIKRTIFTSKATGRRYYLMRSPNRTHTKRYYVCSRPDCDTRLIREADVFCRAHTQRSVVPQCETSISIATSLLFTDEEHSKTINEIVGKTKSRAISDSFDSINDDQQTEIVDPIMDDNLQNISYDATTTESLSSRQKTIASRQIDVDNVTGVMSFRDRSGRRRYLCMKPSCTNMLRRQTDVFCSKHSIDDIYDNNDADVHENHVSIQETTDLSIPVDSNVKSSLTETSQNSIMSSDPVSLEPSNAVSTQAESVRSYRDSSGKIRFLCSVALCPSQVPRKSELFCRRHRLELVIDERLDKSKRIDQKNNAAVSYNGDITGRKMDVNHNNTMTSSQSAVSEKSLKKRKNESLSSTSVPISCSSIVASEMVISTTTLLDHQWADVIVFLRQFPEVKLARNLNILNYTTHLLIDDNQKHLECIITKKIVQAAVRRHIFIVSSRWISACVRSKQLVDEHPFEIISDSHTKLRLSAQNFQIYDRYLFNNPFSTSVYTFAIEFSQCQGSITRNELNELIELAGGKLYDNQSSVDTLVVLCDTNEKNVDQIKAKYVPLNIPNIKYVISDFLLKSIIKFEIQDIEKYSL